MNMLMRDNPLFPINAFIQNKMNSCATIAVRKRRDGGKRSGRNLKGVLIFPKHGESECVEHHLSQTREFHLLVQRQASISLPQQQI